MIQGIQNKMDFTVDHPVRIEFGNGKSAELAKFCGLYGKKVFIVTMQELETLGLLDKAKYGFEKESIEYRLYCDVKPEPKKEDFNDAVTLIREGCYDVIVGFGGGSCIDFAKALAVCATHENDVWNYVNLSSKPPDTIYPEKVLPVIAVPTTSGTGSEVTPYAVIINPDTIQEGTIKDSSIYQKINKYDDTTNIPGYICAYGKNKKEVEHSLSKYFQYNTYEIELNSEMTDWYRNLGDQLDTIGISRESCGYQDITKNKKRRASNANIY
jgi:alcohol dehydrogenase